LPGAYFVTTCTPHSKCASNVTSQNTGKRLRLISALYFCSGTNRHAPGFSKIYRRFIKLYGISKASRANRKILYVWFYLSTGPTGGNNQM